MRFPAAIVAERPGPLFGLIPHFDVILVDPPCWIALLFGPNGLTPLSLEAGEVERILAGARRTWTLPVRPGRGPWPVLTCYGLVRRVVGLPGFGFSPGALRRALDRLECAHVQGGEEHLRPSEAEGAEEGAA